MRFPAPLRESSESEWPGAGHTATDSGKVASKPVGHVWPAAKRAKITKRIGWHTFRHTYATLLQANGEDVKVVQELLRHANSKTTMDTYTQALSPAKRTAQSRVVRMFVGKMREDLA